MPGIDDIIAELGGGGGSSGGGSSSGGSTSSSGGSSAPSGPSEAERRLMARLRASYLDVLRRWGIRTSKNLLNLVEKAIRGQWSTTQFIGQLRHTPEYRRQFRGIQWREGMTEGQYLSTYSQYQARAQDIGEQLSKQMFAKILKRGVTFDEFSDRVDALAAIDEYSPFWKQFQFELEQSGIQVPGGRLTKKELSKFLMGMGSKQWEMVWERAYLTTQLERVAGIQVVEKAKGEVATPDTFEITRGDLLRIIRQVEALSPGFELESMTPQDFAAIGLRLREFKMNYLQRYGITPTDLLEMELGGPGAAKTAERAQRLLKEQEAFFEPRAVPTESQQVGQLAQRRREELPQSL